MSRLKQRIIISRIPPPLTLGETLPHLYLRMKVEPAFGGVCVTDCMKIPNHTHTSFSHLEITNTDTESFFFDTLREHQLCLVIDVCIDNEKRWHYIFLFPDKSQIEKI